MRGDCFKLGRFSRMGKRKDCITHPEEPQITMASFCRV